MTWFAGASGKRGRSLQFSDAVIEFCLTIKNLFGLALRQTIGFVQSLLLTWSKSDFNTAVPQAAQSRYAGDIQTDLHLLADSKDIKFLG